MTSHHNYSPESAGGLMVRNLPSFHKDETVEEVLGKIARESFENIHYVYVITEEQKLVGITTLSKLVLSKNNQQLSEIMEKPKVTVHPETDQEKVVVEAVKNDIKSVAVVDKEEKFLGAVIADQIIDILHEEHLEDFLRSSGIRGKGSHILNLMSANYGDLIRSRLPWLVVGLAIGLLASFVVSFFEASVREHIALVFFMPIVAYMSGAIGTQTETVFIRSMTFLKFNVLDYGLKELVLGMIFGGVIGGVTALFAFFMSGSLPVAMVVGIALFSSMSFATILGIVIPLFLKFLKKDPAIGSGPFITSVQDLISLTIYFGIAALLL